MYIMFVSFKEITESWNNVFFNAESTLSISIFRIFVGCLMMTEAVQWFFYYQKWISPDGYFNYNVFNNYISSTRFTLLRYLPQHNASVRALILLQCLSGFFMFAGMLTQLAAFTCFIATVSLHNRNPYIIDASDTIRRYFCLFLIFAPSDQQLSLADPSRLFNPESQGWPCALILIQLFIANIYLKNVLFKLLGRSWRDGTATEKLFRVKNWNRLSLPAFLDSRWFYRILTYGTLVIETALFSLIWLDELRVTLAVVGIAFHLLLWMFLKIGFFQLTMICGLSTFITSEEYARFIERLMYQPT